MKVFSVQQHLPNSTRPSAPSASVPAQASAAGPRDGSAIVLARVGAVVLLGGAVRVSELGEAIQRSMLDLPLQPARTLLSSWCDQVATLREMIGVDQWELLVRISDGVPRPTIPAKTDHVTVQVEADDSAYRGSGGVLHDLAQRFDDDQYLLVANAAQVLLEPLAELAVALAEPGAAVSLVSHRDGTPSGMMLIRCDVLKQLPAVGFIDLKEQALPGIARNHEVRVLHRERPTGLPVRTLANYITALQALHRTASETAGRTNPFVEDWQSSFALIEPGAEVGDHARIHDSVVLDGGRVGEGAVLVRSVVGPGGVVTANQTIVDRVVSSAGRNGK